MIEETRPPSSTRRKNAISIHVDMPSADGFDNTSQQGRLKDFELLEVVGGGVEGRVYKARERGTGRIYAIKRTSCSDELELKEQIRQLQSVLTHSQQHAHICTHFETFHTTFTNFANEKEYYIYTVMQLCEYGSLEDVIRITTLPTVLIKKWLLQLCDALKYLHNQGLVHRDIKPDNLLLHYSSPARVEVSSPTDDYHQSVLHSMRNKIFAFHQSTGLDDSSVSDDKLTGEISSDPIAPNVKTTTMDVDFRIKGVPINHLDVHLTDFGFMRDVVQNYSAMKSPRGTRIYMAPEIFEAMPYNESVDIWSTGILLLQMMIGWERWKYLNNSCNLQQSILEDSCFIRNILQENENVDQKLVAIVIQCCKKDSVLRPTSEEIVEFLNDDRRSSFDDSIGLDDHYRSVAETEISQKEAEENPSLKDALDFWHENFGDNNDYLYWFTFKTAYFRRYDHKMLNLFAQRGMLKLLCSSPEVVSRSAFCHTAKSSGFPFDPQYLARIGKYGGGSDVPSAHSRSDSSPFQQSKARTKYLTMILENRLFDPLFNTEIMLTANPLRVKPFHATFNSSMKDSVYDMEEEDDKLLKLARIHRKFSFAPPMLARRDSVVHEPGFTNSFTLKNASRTRLLDKAGWTTSDHLSNYSLQKYKGSLQGDNALELLGDDQAQFTVLLGGSCSGKTVLLNALLREFAQRALEDDEAYIPILVPMLSLKENNSGVSFRGKIIHASSDRLLNKAIEYSKDIYNFLHSQIEQARVILLFDGIDSASSRSQRQEFELELEKLINHMDEIGEGGIILSSRSLYESEVFDVFEVFQLLPLSDNLKASLAEHELGREHAKEFMESLQANNQMSDICSVPLFLTILLNSFKHTKMIPTSPSQVFDFAIKVSVETLISARGRENALSPRSTTSPRRYSWGKRHNIKSTGTTGDLPVVENAPEISKEYYFKFLSLFAEHLHSHKIRSMSSDDITKWILTVEALESISLQLLAVWNKLQNEIQNGRFFLIKDTRGKYGFAHLSFQEHLTSLVWADTAQFSMIRRQKKGVIFKRRTLVFSAKAIVQILLEPYYRESILMCARNMQLEDFTKFLKKVLSKNHSSLRISQSELSVVHSILLQTIRRRSVQDQMTKQLQQIVTSINSTKELERLVSGMVHPSPILRKMAFKKIREPFILQNYHDMIVDTLLAGIRSPRTFDIAIESLNSICNELVALNSITAYHKLTKELIDMILSYAKYDALTVARAEHALVIVVKCATSPVTSKRNSITKNSLDLLKIEEKQEKKKKYNCINDIIHSTRSTLQEAMKSTVPSVRAASISALGKICTKEQLSEMKGTFVKIVESDSNMMVIAVAIKSLGLVIDKQTLLDSALVNLISDRLLNKYAEIRAAACSALKRTRLFTNFDQTVDALLKLLLDPVEVVRDSAAKCLCSIVTNTTESLHESLLIIFNMLPTTQAAKVLVYEARGSEALESVISLFLEMLNNHHTAMTTRHVAVSGIIQAIGPKDAVNESVINSLTKLISAASNEEESQYLACLAIKAIDKAVRSHNDYSKARPCPDPLEPRMLDEIIEILVNTVQNKSDQETLCSQAIVSLISVLSITEKHSDIVLGLNGCMIELLSTTRADVLKISTIEFLSYSSAYLEEGVRVKVKEMMNSLLIKQKDDIVLTKTICAALAQLCPVTELIEYLGMDHARAFLFDHIIQHIQTVRHTDPDSSLLFDPSIKEKLNQFKHIESYFILMEAFAIN